MILDATLKEDIQAAFGSLWGMRQRGNSLEIITPFTTTSQKFVSVFISFRDNSIIVSDGGWIEDGTYDNEVEGVERCFQKILLHYTHQFGIKNVKHNNRNFYYKKCQKRESIPSLILDLASFISAIVSASDVDYSNSKETETRFRFQGDANNYLASVVKDGSLKTRKSLDSNGEIKVSAAIEKRQNKMVLINYVTGSDLNYFRGSVSKTHITFEMASDVLGQGIERKICLLDDTAAGYVPIKLHRLLKTMRDKGSSEIVPWTEKEKLVSLI